MDEAKFEVIHIFNLVINENIEIRNKIIIVGNR